MTDAHWGELAKSVMVVHSGSELTQASIWPTVAWQVGVLVALGESATQAA
jgi:hypothetical protein